jgi:hypothetical protein
VPDDPDEWRGWGQKSMGKAWYSDVIARREAAQIAQHEEEELERIEKEKVDAIRKLYDTDRQEYNRQMKAHNLGIQRLAAQVDSESNSVKAVVQGNWEAFLEPTTTDKQTDARAESMELSQSRSHPQKPRHERIVKRTARDQKVGSSNRSKRPASTLTEALVDKKRSNATNIKPSRPKRPKLGHRKGERVSRRLKSDPVECGIYATDSAAPPVPKCLRNPSTRKRDSVDPRNHASSKKLISVEAAQPQEGTRRLRTKKQPGG